MLCIVVFGLDVLLSIVICMGCLVIVFGYIRIVFLFVMLIVVVGLVDDRLMLIFRLVCVVV